MIRDRIERKYVLFIPVYSMRSYETGKYKLNCDGNMARVLSMIYSSNPLFVDIYIPSNNMIDQDDFIALKRKLFNKGIDKKVRFIHTKYGANAKETRALNTILNTDMNYGRASYDVVIVEPQVSVIDASILYGKTNVIYWCVASETISYSPWFTKDYKDLDKYLAQNFVTACATQSQVDYLGGLSYKDEFYNPEFSDTKIIFFPFRLSDESYQWEKFQQMIYQLCKEGVRDFSVIVTDPNASIKTSNIPNLVFAPSSSPIYVSILKGKPIIPYFEKADEVKHIGIEEMVMYNCDIVCYDNKELPDSNNIYKVNDDLAFYDALKGLLTRED